MGLWLPKMFENARKANARPIPLVAVDDLLRDDLNGYKACIDTAASLKFGVVFSSGDLADAEIGHQALAAIEKLGLAASDCMVIADFHDADFTNPDHVAPVIAGVLDTLQSLASWRQIVFQGTNFPEKIRPILVSTLSSRETNGSPGRKPSDLPRKPLII